jgi:hypothetical protein
MVPLDKNAMSQGLSSLVNKDVCVKVGIPELVPEVVAAGGMAHATSAKGKAANKNRFM